MIAKELERDGIPVVQCCNMTPVAHAVGVSRIMEAPSIKYPFGRPSVPLQEEKVARIEMLRRALKYLTE